MVERPFECPLCAGQVADPFLDLRDEMTGGETQYALVRCRHCSLLRLHPAPDAATLAAAYRSDYAPHTRRGLSGWAKGRLEGRSVRQLWALFGPPRRVLDVGCATGELLVRIRAAGNPDVFGIEPGAEAAAVARRRGLPVILGTLDDARLQAESVDTVIMSHTLEHVADPLLTLREVARVLRPGGALVLWLPNASSVEARVLGRYWIGYDAPRHLTTFTVATLSQALLSAGLDVDSVRHEAVGLEWAWGLRLWLRRRAPAVERVLRRFHAPLIVAATPLALIGALTHRSGRIRVIARKPA